MTVVPAAERLIPYPATVIVGQDGRIRWLHLGLAACDRPTRAQLLAALRSLTR